MKKLLSLFIVSALCIPFMVGAQTPPTGGNANTDSGGSRAVVGGNANTDSGGSRTAVPAQGQRMIGLPNPLGDKVTSIPDLFYLIVNSLFKLSYIVVAGFILWSGFKFVTAQGEPDAISDAKNTFKYTIVGALIIIGAQTIIEIVKGIITGLGIA